MTGTLVQKPVLEDERKKPARLPGRLEPFMAAHFALTGDAEQYAEWRAKVESIRQTEALAQAEDPESRAILLDREAWHQMRITGKLGTLFGLGLSSFWMAWLLPVYALYHGFGWVAAMTFLLPIPIAWRVGRRLWEKAALAGMKDLGKRPSLRRRVKTAFRSIARSFGAGFGFGFTLVFLQALITYFMTPAPTLIAELMIDGFHATLAGLISGGMGVMLAPLVGRPAPEAEDNALPPGMATPLIPEET